MTQPPSDAAKQAFDYGPDRLIARDRQDAKRIIRVELGERVRDKELKRAKPPFLLADTDGEAYEVDETEFCERVDTYGEGMVFRP